MKPLKSWSTAAMLAGLVLVLLASTRSYADTYQIFDLGHENGHNLYGIDSSGAVVTVDPPLSPSGFLYRTWVNGVVVATSSTPPPLNYDNGASCPVTISPSSGITGPMNGVCNNGHEIYLGYYQQAGLPFQSRGIFTGPDLSDLLTTYGTLDRPVINALGDVAWIDGSLEEFYMAIN